MSFRMSTLERAFQLAESGLAQSTGALRVMLRREGYEPRQIEGRSLIRQLKAIIDAVAARDRSAHPSV